MSRPVFVDTSALYAIHDRDDDRHVQARQIWTELLDQMERGSTRCVTHSAVIIETSALVQRRLGIDSLRDLHRATLPVLDVTWIDAELHERAVAALLAAGLRNVSLVDWTSFEVMRSLGITEAFAFDDDFTGQGLTLL